MSAFFLTIVNMSISASWLVLAVLLLRPFLKRCPKWILVLLWSFVAVRLICPYTFESTLSLVPSAQTISPEITMDSTPQIHTGFDAVNNSINTVISDSFTPEPSASVNSLQIWIALSASIWTVGIAVMLIYAIVSYILLRQKVAAALPCRDNIFQSENIASPFVLGLIIPRIYIPYGIQPQDLEYVIAHEQAHICRKDHWWKPLGFVLLALHWFNPILWLGYILLCRDIELACDEKVIKGMNNEAKADYTQALVDCSVNRRSIAACPLAFGEVGVRERVKSVMNYRKPAFWIIGAALLTCCVVAVCFLTNPVSNTLQTIDNYALSIPSAMPPVFVLEDDAYVYAGSVERAQIQEFYDLQISRKEISQDRSEDRDKTHSLMVKSVSSNTPMLSSYLPGIHFHFNADFTEVWANDDVKPTFTYRVKNPQKAREIFLRITTKSNEPIAMLQGNLKTYYSMADGTFEYNGQSYQYRLEITGRMPNAKVDCTFVYLSNLQSISFERAYKAAGVSSNSEDYFSAEEAVLVEWINDEIPGASNHPLQEKYPEYFDLSSMKGLEVYVWQTEEGPFRCGVMCGTNRIKTASEISSLKPASLEEMRSILATYDLSKDYIDVIPVSLPLTEQWYEIDEVNRLRTEAMFWGDVRFSQPSAIFVNALQFNEYLDKINFVPGLSQGDFITQVGQYRYHGASVTDGDSVNYDGPNGGGWMLTHEMFEFCNDCRIDREDMYIEHSNQLITRVPLEDLALPYGIEFSDNLEDVFHKVGIKMDPNTDFTADNASHTTMTLYLDEGSSLVFRDLRRTQESVDYLLPYVLCYTEAYELYYGTMVNRQVELSFQEVDNGGLGQIKIKITETDCLEYPEIADEAENAVFGISGQLYG